VSNNTVYLVKTRTRVPKQDEYTTHNVVVEASIPAAIKRFLGDWQKDYDEEPLGTISANSIVYFEVSVICPDGGLTLPKDN
jgi:hypothetical protein